MSGYVRELCVSSSCTVELQKVMEATNKKKVSHGAGLGATAVTPAEHSTACCQSPSSAQQQDDFDKIQWFPAASLVSLYFQLSVQLCFQKTHTWLISLPGCQWPQPRARCWAFQEKRQTGCKQRAKSTKHDRRLWLWSIKCVSPCENRTPQPSHPERRLDSPDGQRSNLMDASCTGSFIWGQDLVGKKVMVTKTLQGKKSNHICISSSVWVRQPSVEAAFWWGCGLSGASLCLHLLHSPPHSSGFAFFFSSWGAKKGMCSSSSSPVPALLQPRKRRESPSVASAGRLRSSCSLKLQRSF